MITEACGIGMRGRDGRGGGATRPEAAGPDPSRGPGSRPAVRGGVNGIRRGPRKRPESLRRSTFSPICTNEEGVAPAVTDRRTEDGGSPWRPAAEGAAGGAADPPLRAPTSRPGGEVQPARPGSPPSLQLKCIHFVDIFHILGRRRRLSVGKFGNQLVLCWPCSRDRCLLQGSPTLLLCFPPPKSQHKETWKRLTTFC